MKFHHRLGLIVLIVILALGVSNGLAAQGEGVTPDVSPIPATNPMTTWYSEAIQKGPDFGSHVSIAFDEDHNDTPWVAYFNADRGSLWVAHYVGLNNGNCGSLSDWDCEEVDYVNGEIKGKYTSIDIHPDTNPDPLFTTWRVGVSYYDESYSTLKYARYSCVLFACSWDIDTVDISPDAGDRTGQWSSMKFSSNGTPLIAYHKFNDTTLIDWDNVMYAVYVGSSSGNCGDYNNWDCSMVESSTADIGRYISLDLDFSGTPYIAWYDATADDLDYAYYAGIGDCFTDAEWICRTIESTDTTDVGRWVSFHARQNVSDVMRAAYYDATNGTLKYAYTTTGGNCGTGGGWQCDTIEYIGENLILADISLAVDSDNHPMIAYTDASEEFGPAGLRLAVPAYFSKYANCGGPLIYDWYCQTIQNGDAHHEEAQYVAAGIKENGIAVIAYSEWDNYYEYYILRVAYQVFETVLPLTVKH